MYGKPWRYRGVVGVGVDVDRGRIYFSYNGNWTGDKDKNQQLGLAFDNISFRGGIMPAATICGLCGQQVQFNFGDKKFQFEPSSSKDCPIKEAQPIWKWVTAYRPNQPKWYVMPSVVGGALPTDDDAADESSRGDAERDTTNDDAGKVVSAEDCPCGTRHKGSFNGFPERRGAKESFGAPAALVPTSGAGVLRLEKALPSHPNERIARATHGRPSAVLQQLAPAKPFVDGRRYYEVRVKELDRSVVGSAAWRVGWACRGFLGDWSSDIGVGDEERSIGLSCVSNHIAMRALLFGGPHTACAPLIVHPTDEGERCGAEGTHRLHVQQLGSTDETQHGVGWEPREVDDKHCAYVVIKFERPSLLVRVAGINVNATAVAIDYCLLQAGEPHPPADAESGAAGWTSLQKLKPIERNKVRTMAQAQHTQNRAQLTRTGMHVRRHCSARSIQGFSASAARGAIEMTVARVWTTCRGTSQRSTVSTHG